MSTVLLVIHLLLALALVGIILMQRSEGGGLTGGGGSGGFMTTRGTANLLTRTTGVLAGLFMLTSLALVILAAAGRPSAPRSILDAPVSGAPAVPSSTPGQSGSTQPQVPVAN